MITNKCIFMGTVYEIKPLSYTQGNKEMTTLCISVKVGKGADGKPIYEFVPCRAYGGTAKMLCDYFSKGKAIAVESHVHRYKNNEGRVLTEFIVDGVNFVPADYVEQKPAQQTESNTTTTAFSNDYSLTDDLPF